MTGIHPRTWPLCFRIIGIEPLVKVDDGRPPPAERLGVAVQEGKIASIVVSCGGRIPYLALVRSAKPHGSIVYANLIFLDKHRGGGRVAYPGKPVGDFPYVLWVIVFVQVAIEPD